MHLVNGGLYQSCYSVVIPSNGLMSKCIYDGLTHATNSMMCPKRAKKSLLGLILTLPTTHCRLITDSRLNSDEFSHSHQISWASAEQLCHKTCEI